ncbi:alanine racemase [Allonocardiopsis opalescens]|uniref:D-serine deaminase-like pyridoxal phosphate-dependent protein n=1 Tax=Allonocardiopsis opalescens TaxID=1144618 RepID=A0A2T0Q1W2_9ACTN|nr:alanine racemase [Allonocardiopsis opalescens]PRX97783.1 D-serine deaminase-like pyridoxal phosphate-dependent protein [Allonocardiopsis opalescens]
MGAGTDGLMTPALLVDRGRLAANVAEMAERTAARGVALRPHVKTSKSLDVARAQLAAGAIGFTCSTPAEVRLLQDAGIGGLVWAHQPVGPAKLAFAVAAARRGGLTVTVDSVEVAAPLGEALAEAGTSLPVLIEVDTGLGRTGADPGDVLALAEALTRWPALRLCGVLTHEGQLYAHAGDRAGLERAGRRAGEVMAGLGERLRAAGHPAGIVSVGSTPGATSTPFVPGVTETRAGTYVYYDANQVALGSVPLERCALTVLATVVSTRRRGTAIIDAGLKAMSSDRSVTGEGFGAVLAPTPGGGPLDGVAFTAANEEHGFLTGPGTARLTVGDRVRIVPNHACTTVNMWSEAQVLDGAEVVARWRISARH